jgi:hypothetical protein
MSGGPIFGFIIGEQIRYWTVALQSAWYSEARVVVGCPISIIAGLISSYMDQATGSRSEEGG